jgi:DNA polymerase III subunit delta'
MAASTPLCFSELLGQEKAKRLVTRSITANRVPHAYIFKGPEGVGKKMFARGLAAALNCRAGEKGKACGICSSCRKFRSGNHPDFMVISPDKGTIKIDQVREMCRALSYPPYESELRVVLLEDVHTMRPEAANSLLKTLEEPPANNLLILTAEASREILTTISSRCQVVPFFGLTEEQTVEILRRRESTLDQESAQLLARLAEGSPGRALLLYKAELIDTMKKIVDLVTTPAGNADGNVGLLLQMAEEMAALKENLSPLFGLLRLWLRDVLLGGDEFRVAMPDSGKSWSSELLFAKLAAIDQAERELSRNCNRTLVCEVVLFHLCSMRQSGRRG